MKPRRSVVERGRQRGFTLVETVVTLFVVAVGASALIAPIFTMVGLVLWDHNRNDLVDTSRLAMNRVAREIETVRDPNSILTADTQEFRYLGAKTELLCEDRETYCVCPGGPPCLRNGLDEDCKGIESGACDFRERLYCSDNLTACEGPPGNLSCVAGTETCEARGVQKGFQRQTSQNGLYEMLNQYMVENDATTGNGVGQWVPVSNYAIDMSFRYYNASGNIIPAPVPADQLYKIRSIRLSAEFDTPKIDAGEGDTYFLSTEVRPLGLSDQRWGDL